jgi:hypothetical protein
MNWKGCGRKSSWPNLWYYPGICLEGLRKTMKNLSQNSRCPNRYLNPGPPEYEAGVLTTQPRGLVTALHNNGKQMRCMNSCNRRYVDLHSKQYTPQNHRSLFSFKYSYFYLYKIRKYSKSLLNNSNKRSNLSLCTPFAIKHHKININQKLPAAAFS